MFHHLDGSEQFARERADLRDCGNYLLFHHYYTVGKVRLAAMRSCKRHLLCPLCAIRRGAKSLRSYLDRFQAIRQQSPALRPYLVTFTVANGDDLGERFEHLKGSLQRLHGRRREWNKGKRGAPWSESCRAAGAVWSYEVTNRGKGWHPHAHAIWLCDTPPDRWALVEEWKAITGDSCVVDVRPIQQDDPAEGFAEVFKYAMKFSDLTLSDNLEAYQALRGRRLVGSFGCFRGVQVPEELTDELLDELPYIELLYTYRPSAGGYSLKSAGAVQADPDQEGGSVPGDSPALVPDHVGGSSADALHSAERGDILRVDQDLPVSARGVADGRRVFPADRPPLATFHPLDNDPFRLLDVAAAGCGHACHKSPWASCVTRWD